MIKYIKLSRQSYSSFVNWHDASIRHIFRMKNAISCVSKSTSLINEYYFGTWHNFIFKLYSKSMNEFLVPRDKEKFLSLTIEMGHNGPGSFSPGLFIKSQYLLGCILMSTRMEAHGTTQLLLKLASRANRTPLKVYNIQCIIYDIQYMHRWGCLDGKSCLSHEDIWSTVFNWDRISIEYHINWYW